MPLIQSSKKSALKKNIKTEMDANPGKSHMKQNLAIAYAVQKKNKKAKGGLVRAASERPTADSHEYGKTQMLAEGGEVRAGSERPTADSGQVHNCTEACQDMTVRAHEMIRAGSVRPSADSGQGNPAGVKPTSGGADRRGGSAPVSADSGERTNAPLRSGGRAQPTRAASTRPTADNDEMGQTQMLAFGGDVEGESEDHRIGTMAEAIADRIHRKMMAQGGMAHDDGLEDNSEEKGNFEDDLSFDALGKENYDDSQLSEQPEDSNETGDDLDERDKGEKDSSPLVSKIRSRAKKGKAA